MTASKAADDLRIDFTEQLIVPSDPAGIQRVQQLVVKRLQAGDFCERDVFAIRLALEEALINAIKHGNQLDRSKKVCVAFAITEGAFYVRVGDEGCGFNPDDVPDPTLAENLERACGRGLMLMRHYMNEVRFLDRGNVVLMWKCRNGKA